MLSFFATEDRIHSLKQPQLRALLDATLWEPGAFSSATMSNTAPVPQEVPCAKPELLSTAYGLMLNELYRSPAVVLTATVKLLKLALDLNTGTVHGSTTEVILFVCRLASRVDSYVSFVIELTEGTHQSMAKNNRSLRDIDVSPETIVELKHGLVQIRSLLHGDLLAMIKDFSVSAYREYKDTANEETLNVNSQIICCLHSHLILAYRNMPLSSHDSSSVLSFMASFVHVNCRHSFNTGRHVDLPNTEYVIPETQLYEALQVQRRRLVNWCQPASLSDTDPGAPEPEPAPEAEAEAEAKAVDKKVALEISLSDALSSLALLAADGKTADGTDATQEDSVALCHTIATLADQIKALPLPRPVKAPSPAEAEAAVSGVATAVQLSDVMTAIQTITSDTGSFAGPDKESSSETAENWGFIAGWNNSGRFTVTSLGKPKPTDTCASTSTIATVKSSAGLGAQIDFQLAALTVKNAHVVALDEAVANMADVKAVFGNESMQATCLQSAEHRVWYRLMGRGHEIQFWHSADARKFKEFPTCLGEYEREYFEDLDKNTEMWAAQIFEPIRQAYFVPPPPQPPIRFLMRVLPAKEDATVITMLAIHPDKEGAWKEVVISKAHETVQVYEIISHGRRWYKSLQYCNDRRYALRCLAPDMTFVRRSGWPEWERHGGGHPLSVHSVSDVTTVITRSWGVTGKHSRNLSGGVETYIPDRLLFGVVPQALLDPKYPKDDKDRVKHTNRYEFWQGEDDHIRGYPVTVSGDDQQHIIEVDLQEDVEPVDCTKVSGGTCAKVTRVSRTVVEREYGQLISLCEKIIAGKLLPESALDGGGSLHVQELSETKEEDHDHDDDATGEAQASAVVPEVETPVAAAAAAAAAAGGRNKKGGRKAAAPVAEEAPVSFALFRFVQTLTRELSLSFDRATRFIDNLIAGTDTGTGNEKPVAVAPLFKTRLALRKAIEALSVEEPNAEPTLQLTGTQTESGASSSVSLMDEDLNLLDLLYAEKDSKLHSLCNVISRLESLAYVLCWSRSNGDGDVVAVVELPRLSLTFVAKSDENGVVRLESSDHAGLFIHTATFGLDKQTTEMLRGMPHSLVLTDTNGQHTILCAALPLLRPVIPEDPFSTELVLDRDRITSDRARSWVDGRKWAKHVDKYFLYPVHVSKTFLLHRSLASALYLLVIRLLNRNYQAAFALANAIATDKEYSPAERCIFMYVAEASYDMHPDAHSCRLRITHAIATVPKVKEIIPWE